jgi:fucose 4-O-acetylase-like acetyltransferase
MGHIVQYSLTKPDFYQNPLFIFIYSFHMPLFIGISGYLFYYSTKRTFKEILTKRFHQLIVPLFIWSFLFFVVTKFKSPENNFISYIIPYFGLVLRVYWFLSILFICSIVLFLNNQYMKKWYYHLLFIFLLLLIPDFLSSRFLKFMYPMFLLGFVYNKYSTEINKYMNYIISGSFILFLTLLYYWKNDYFVYVSGTQILYHDGFNLLQVKNDILRYLAGISGSIVVLFIAKLLFDKLSLPLVQLLGRKTLGIYLVHLLLLEIVSYRLIKIPTMFYFQVLLNTLLILIASMAIIIFLEKWNITKSLLLGETLEKGDMNISNAKN